MQVPYKGLIILHTIFTPPGVFAGELYISDLDADGKNKIYQYAESLFNNDDIFISLNVSYFWEDRQYENNALFAVLHYQNTNFGGNLVFVKETIRDALDDDMKRLFWVRFYKKSKVLSLQELAYLEVKKDTSLFIKLFGMPGLWRDLENRFDLFY